MFQEVCDSIEFNNPQQFILDFQIKSKKLYDFKFNESLLNELKEEKIDLTLEQLIVIKNLLFSKQQLGKNSHGKNFEDLIAKLLDKYNIVYHRQVFEEIKSDFIIPIKDELPICLSIKTTTKERWSETIKELSQKVSSVYFYTCEQNIPKSKINEINKSGIKFIDNFNDFISLIKMKSLTCVDLFCGCAGFSSGFKNVNVILGIDNNKDAINSFKENNPTAKTILDDIRNVKSEDIPNCDIIVGGFPCVSYSMAGKRDCNDERGFLYKEFVRIVKDKNPSLFLFENVKGLLSAKTSEGLLFFDVIRKEFQDLGYTLQHQLFNCDEYGIPQIRKRIICVGIRNDIKKSFIFPNPSNEVINAWDLLLPRENVDKSYFLSEKMVTGFKSRKEKNMLNGKGFGYQVLKHTGASYTISSRYHKDGSDCLVVYDDGVFRKLTELECLRIQSFPDDYKICGSKVSKYQQIGNAVPYKLSCLLNDSIINFFSNNTIEKTISTISEKLTFDEMNVEQLRFYCKENKISGYSKYRKKADLISFLKSF